MPLPTFMVIGAAKAGTTALYSYLRQHPKVYLPSTQEPSWFAFDGQELEFTGPDGHPPAVNQSAITGRGEYEALYRGAKADQARGDVSPVYLYWPETAERVAAEVPGMRVVAIFRHPVDRAFSAFMHARREGREPLAEFREALQAEPARIAANCGFLWRYRDLGRYAPQLRRWLRVFPPERMLLITYDDFASDPVTVCRRVQGFIGVDQSFEPDTRIRHNVSGVPRSRIVYDLLGPTTGLARTVRRLVPQPWRQPLRAVQLRTRGHLVRRATLDPDLRMTLTREWRSDIEEFADLVDLDIGHWLEPAAQTGR